MAFTLSQTKVDSGPRGLAQNRYFFQVTGPASYTNTGVWATSGEALSAAAIGITVTLLPTFTIDNGAGTVRLVTYDYTNKRLHVFVPNTGAEVANATDLSSFTGRFEVIGY